jgi:hypothetical protein
MTKNELISRIEELRARERKAFGPRHGKTDFYDPLGGVLDLYGDFRREKKRKTYLLMVASIYGIKVRKNTHSIRVIIDACSKKDVFTKCEWTRALRYALTRPKALKKQGLKGFLKSNGGTAGCAEKYSKARRKPAN